MKLAAMLLLSACCCAIGQPIERNRAEVRAFRAANPCPSTGKTRGPCVSHQVDHAVPICAGGLDDRSNMQWISVADHKWKTFVDQRECRKLRRMAGRPAE